MVIRQGDVFWVDVGDPQGSAQGYRRPHVVVQNDFFNHSRINTTVVCAITSNTRLSESPGNVELPLGEANLPKKSVVNISQLFTVNKDELTEWIGSLSPRSLKRVVSGIYLLLEPD
jgi:mRNA interferase MazF